METREGQRSRFETPCVSYVSRFAVNANISNGEILPDRRRLLQNEARLMDGTWHEDELEQTDERR